MTDHLVNSKELLVTDDPSFFKRQVTDNLVNSGAFDDEKSIGSLLEVLAWIIMGYCGR